MIRRALLVVATCVLVACGSDSRPASSASGASTVSGPSGPSGPIASADPREFKDATLGQGSWQGARTNGDGRELLIVLVGGPPYSASNPCSTDYRGVVTETDSQVRVRVQSTSPAAPPSDQSTVACATLGYPRYVIVRLEQSLGSRALVEAQFDRTQPVFDGSTLADIGALPAGWVQIFEGPGLAEPGYWSRSFGPPTPPPTASQCTPGDSGIELIEGASDLPAKVPDSGVTALDTPDVHGVTATYVGNATQGIFRLSWVERDRGFVVTTSPGCQGDTPASEQTMVDFARGLKLP